MDEKRDRVYWKWGLTALGVICISVVLVVIFTDLPGFFGVLRGLEAILEPLILGAVFAFLLNPIVRFVDTRLGPLLGAKTKWKAQAVRNVSRGAGVVTAVIVAALILYAFFSMLLPQLYESVVGIVDNAENYYTSIDRWVTNVLEDNPEIQGYVDSALGKIYEFINNWITTTFLQDVQKLLATVTTSVVAVVKKSDERSHRAGRVGVHSVVEGDISGAGEEDHRGRLLPQGRGPHFLPRAEYLPGVQRVRDRQDRRFGDHRRAVLHRDPDPQDAVPGSDRHGHRRDERHPVLRAAHRAGPVRVPPSAGEPSAGVLFRDLHSGAAADRRERDRAEDPGEHGGHLRVLGAGVDHDRGESVRVYGG